MTFESVLMLLGGLALFLYGMHMMSNGLEGAAGDKMKGILEKLTSNRFLGILVGAGITAVVQSSSATTVMVVGFVNSQLMTLRQAVWIIMGANVGTTITGQLIALDASKIAPLVAIVGVIMVTFIKKKKINSIGEIFGGLGILFIGLDMMKNAMVPLQGSPMFIDAMSTISNPVLAILLGAAFTALIQSSSASVGILQALAVSGLVPLHTAVYIIFGQNIGTCITSFMASLGANRNAKRTTIIHLSFNIIGTTIFLIVVNFIPFVDWMEAITTNPAAQIANAHTAFNIATTLLLLPFGNQLAKLATVILPIKPEEMEDSSENVPLMFIDVHNIGSIPIAISNLRKEALVMLKLSETNLIQSIETLIGIEHDFDKIRKREKRINFINMEMTDYMTKVSQLNMNDEDSTTCNALYKSYADIERIGDHAMNMIQYAEPGGENVLSSHEHIKEELLQLKELLEKSFSLLFTYRLNSNDDCYEKIERIEDRIDELTETYRQTQIDRLLAKKVNANDCVIYSEILTDIERVSDHMINVIQECKRCSFTLNDEELMKDMVSMPA
ncbi:Na/Pi cotransporter family protein [Amedibacillus sp. YH-ame6]